MEPIFLSEFVHVLEHFSIGQKQRQTEQIQGPVDNLINRSSSEHPKIRAEEVTRLQFGESQIQYFVVALLQPSEEQNLEKSEIPFKIQN
jgi:hypothetical protein